MSTTTLRVANADDRPLLERLWLMFRHDMSEFDHDLPDSDGTFHSDRPGSALDDADWTAYIIVKDDRPAGLVLVRGVSGPVRVLNTFFVVRGARRSGLGGWAVRELTALHPGPWEIAFQDTNESAVLFWRYVATAIAGDDWTLDRRAVPGRPELPPDTWISFTPGDR